MRKLVLMLAVAGITVPSSAMACHYGQSSSVSVSCEGGVKVYRGTPLAAPNVPVIVQNNAVSDQLTEQRMALQNERLAAQSERIDNLQSQLRDANRPRSRSRYGRRYYAPIGSFGGGRFIRGRGYRGFNRRHNSAIRVTYNRRRF